MPSTLLSTSCSINTEPYTLLICIDDDSTEVSGSTIDDLVLTIDNCKSTSNALRILNSIQLHFKSLTDLKKNVIDTNDETIPETILLNKLLNIKQNVKVSNSSSLSQRSERSSTQATNKNDRLSSSESSKVELSYVDISDSFIWTVKRIQLDMDSRMAQQLCLISSRCLPKLNNRPRHLLVFINPECGKGVGGSVYEEKVLPLFEEANINVNTIYTERANHARDYITETSLDEYDGIISVGGDGMFSELCHSLLLKKAQEAGLNVNDPNTKLIPPNLRIGVIPAGSTDAIAFGTTGHNDPITNALQIIVGESLLIDITTVHNEHGFIRFMATMFAYGFFGNIIEQSENWRFVGPLRYTLAGIFQFIRNTSYHTELIITQPSDNPSKRQEMVDTSSTLKEEIDSEKSSSSFQIKREDYYRTINCLNMPCRCDQSKYGMSPTVHLADGSFDIVLVKHSWWLPFLRFLHQVASDGREIEDLSNVERFRATNVVIRPIVSGQKELGNWSCDGELIEANEIRISSHQRALRLFASGIHLDEIKQINKEESNVVGKVITKRFDSFTNILSTKPWHCLFLFFLLLFLFVCLYYRFFLV